MQTKSTITPLPATSTTTLRPRRTRTRRVAPAAAPPARETSGPAAAPRAEVLRRAEGIELIGRYEGSGFRNPPLIARRADGQVVQLTELLYAVAEAADGRRDLHEIARHVSARCDRPLSADNIDFIAERKLRPLGILALRDGSTPTLPKREPLVALRHRRPLLSERTVNAGARLFTWLHLPVVTAVVLLTIVAFDVWLFGFQGIAGGLRRAIYEPFLLLGVFGAVVVGTAFHEFGHASACRYGGARPGVMGAGFYLVWPAFYCDVTDAYRLDRRGRLRTDLGGVYFNGIFALLLGGLFFLTGEHVALFAAFTVQVLALQQLLPLLRFDGYYVLTDLTGVPDILTRIKPIFRSLLPGSEAEPRVAELKPWVRVVVTAYVLTLVPAMAFLFGWMLLSAPRILATVSDSIGLQAEHLDDGLAAAAAGVLRIALLVLQVAAMALSVWRVAGLARRSLTGWSRGSAVRTLVAATIAVALIAGLAYIWWPNGDYEPIRPGERGTIGEAVSAIPAAAGGRPSFTPEQEQRYGAVPTPLERQRTTAEPAATPGDVRRERDRSEDRGTSSEDRRDSRDGRWIEDDGSDALTDDEDFEDSGDSSSIAPTETTTAPTSTTDSTFIPSTTTDPTSSTSTAPAPTPTTTPDTSTTPTTTTGTSTTPTTTTDTSTTPTTTTDTSTTPTTTPETSTTPTTTTTEPATGSTTPTTTETTTTPSG